MLTLPAEMALPEAELPLSKVVYFESNLRTITPRNVSVSLNGNGCYTIYVTIDLLLGEIIRFYITWTTKALKAGNYSISISASSIDPDMDVRFRVAQGDLEIHVLEDAPTISELIFLPELRPIDFDPQEMYTSPGQEIEIRCNITCFSGTRNVTVYYSIEPSGVWDECFARRISEHEWVATIPGQPERVSLVFYLKAYSMLGASSRTKEYKYIFLDMHALVFKTNVIGTLMVVTIVIGLLLILVLKRREMTER